MTVTLTPQTEARINQMALREGKEPHDVVESILEDALSLDASEYEKSVADIQEGLDAIEQGRERSAEEFFAEHRAKYPSPLK